MANIVSVFYKFFLILFLLVSLIGGYYFFSKKETLTESSSPTPTPQPQKKDTEQAVEVYLPGSQFYPKTFTKTEAQNYYFFIRKELTTRDIENWFLIRKDNPYLPQLLAIGENSGYTLKFSDSEWKSMGVKAKYVFDENSKIELVKSDYS